MNGDLSQISLSREIMTPCLRLALNEILYKATRLRVDYPSQAVNRAELVVDGSIMFEVKDSIPNRPPSSLRYAF